MAAVQYLHSTVLRSRVPDTYTEISKSIVRKPCDANL